MSYFKSVLCSYFPNLGINFCILFCTTQSFLSASCIRLHCWLLSAYFKNEDQNIMTSECTWIRDCNNRFQMFRGHLIPPQVLNWVVYFNQLLGAHHTWIYYHDNRDSGVSIDPLIQVQFTYLCMITVLLIKREYTHLLTYVLTNFLHHFYITKSVVFWHFSIILERWDLDTCQNVPLWILIVLLSLFELSISIKHKTSKCNLNWHQLASQQIDRLSCQC